MSNTLRRRLSLGAVATLLPAVAQACPNCASVAAKGPYLAATAILLLVPVAMGVIFYSWLRKNGSDGEEAPTGKTTKRVRGVPGSLGFHALLLMSFVTLC